MTRRFGRILKLGLLLALPTGMLAAKEVDWASLNSAFKDAEHVKDAATCFNCHAESEKPYSHTAHFKAFKEGKAPESGDCGSCHGPRSKHVENPTAELKFTASQWNAVCLQCHEGGDRMYWSSTKHASEASCISCHSVMENKSEKALLAGAKQEAVCYTCHSEVRGEMNKPSHHPVREGKVDCSGCHNPHGSPTAKLLKGNSVNETCFQCHQEKRGPYLWQHPPVIENCATCHDAHGSNNRKLLTSKDSLLCLECHSYGGHVNEMRYNRVSSSYGEGCVNCHFAIHGSNSPSGAKLTR